VSPSIVSPTAEIRTDPAAVVVVAAPSVELGTELGGAVGDPLRSAGEADPPLALDAQASAITATATVATLRTARRRGCIWVTSDR
jgi:hypothetical protein